MIESSCDSISQIGNVKVLSSPDDSTTYNVTLPERKIGLVSLLRPMLVVTRFGIWLIYARQSQNMAEVVSEIGIANNYTLSVGLSWPTLTLTFNKAMYSGYRLIVLD